ncbi:hypothetical protein [Bacteroides oleiciplenus]|uniref:hypothetical protein n=1 Tax=Bacteroides oleiciplenus TaxID=626931 RepID=UPI0026DAA938|nr:hypothetical protein [Bacteroides oleiciplenus]
MNAIYGLNQVKFDGKEIGWIDEQGLQPAGTAPTQVDVYAAQVKDGPIATITSNPGKKAFTCNLIDLSTENLVNIIGGTKDANGNWEPPEKWEKTAPMDISCDSGETIRFFNAKVTGNDFANGINSQGVLALGLNIELLKDDKGKSLKIFAKGIDPETGNPTVNPEG